MLPDLGGGDDEGAVGLGGIELGEALGEVAQEAGADGDVVGCGGRGDVDRRHVAYVTS